MHSENDKLTFCNCLEKSGLGLYLTETLCQRLNSTMHDKNEPSEFYLLLSCLLKKE